MTVIAVALAARILDAGGEVVITREEYERVCQSNIDRDRDIMAHVEADTMTMRYMDLAEGEGIIEADRQRETRDALADLLRVSCEAIASDPDASPAHREAARHQLTALDALIAQRGWRATPTRP
jgi:hypothetical protein